ncbi:hypothetical protein ABIA58_004156 [Pseudomonas frederiksbergensis]
MLARALPYGKTQIIIRTLAFRWACNYFAYFYFVTRNEESLLLSVTGNEVSMTDDNKTKTTTERQREFRE